MQNYRKLKVWESSYKLTLHVYVETRTFPKDELYGLVSQLRRANVSIGANIAEGCGKATDADFANYLQIAMGSANEVDYLLLLSHDLKYLSMEKYQPLSKKIVETQKMLSSLIKRLKTNH